MGGSFCRPAGGVAHFPAGLAAAGGEGSVHGGLHNVDIFRQHGASLQQGEGAPTEYLLSVSHQARPNISPDPSTVGKPIGLPLLTSSADGGGMQPRRRSDGKSP